MISSSLSSTEGLIKGNLQYSPSSVTPVVQEAHYSRHLSSGHGTRSSNRKPRKIIHVTIRTPKTNRHPRENKSVTPTIDLRSIPSGLTSRDYQDDINNSDIIPNSASQARSATPSSRVDETPRSHRVLSQLSHNSYPQEHNDRIVLQTNHFPSNTNRISTHINSNAFENNNDTTKKEDCHSTKRDILENSGTRKKKKCSALLIRRCTWALIFLIIALILGAAIAGALAATLIKHDTTTTITTIPEITTTISTALAATTNSTTVTIPPSTTTITTLSTTVISILSTTTITTPSTTVTTTITTPSTTVTTTITTPSTTVTTTFSTTTISTTKSTTGTTKTTTSTTTTAVQTIVNAGPTSSSSGYGGTDNIKINCTTTLTNITVQIFVLNTNGATSNSLYGTYWGGTVTPSYITNGTHIIYTWTIISGQTITCSGGPYTFTAQFNSNGTARVTTGDTYIVTAQTSSGVTNILSGHF